MARLIEVDLDAVEKKFYNCLAAHYHDSYGRGFTAGLKAMLGFLKEQPTIEPKQEWISVKDRLPETDEEIVLAVVFGKPCENIELIGAYETALYSCEEGWIIEYYPEWEEARVTHWIPLPEPPKEGE